MATQAKEIYDKFQAALDQREWEGSAWQLNDDMIPDRLRQFVERYVDLDRVGLGHLDLGEGLATLLEKLSLFLLEHSSELVTGLLSFVTSFLIMLVTMFFLFRDSARLSRDFRHLSPLSDEYQHQIMSTFRQVASATVVGSLVTAVVQGIAGGLVFWIVGIDQAIFWGTLTAFFSLVPVVGTALVWVPWAIYLLSTVSGASGFVFIGLFLLVGLLDNVVRPFFIEGRVKMHTLLVFFSLMGGVSYLGLPGLIFGPILVALGTVIFGTLPARVRTARDRSAVRMNTYGRWIERRERILTLRDTSRRILPFDWGLECLGDAGGGDPLTQVKRYARTALADRRFYESTPPRNLRRSGDRLTFETPVESAYPVNNTVHARIFPGPDRRRAVVVVPQWNADATSHVGLCRLLTRLGHHRHTPVPALPTNGGCLRGKSGPNTWSAPTSAGPFRPRAKPCWKCCRPPAGSGTRATNTWESWGTSIGSCVTFLAFVHDPLIETGVFNHVSSSFAQVVWTGLATRYVRWGLEGYIARDDLERCWAPISPWYFIPRLRESRRPHLLITARYDLTFIPELSQRVFLRYREHGIPFDRIELPCGHYTTARFPFIYMDGWHICRYLHRHLGRRQ